MARQHRTVGATMRGVSEADVRTTVTALHVRDEGQMRRLVIEDLPNERTVEAILSPAQCAEIVIDLRVGAGQLRTHADSGAPTMISIEKTESGSFWLSLRADDPVAYPVTIALDEMQAQSLTQALS